MAKIKPQTLKGFRDFLPGEMVLRQKVISLCKEVFESFGFEALETPTLEYAETLLGKYGKEADRLVYLFRDRGGRQVGLRYDLTVPTARVMAQYKNVPLPFKRYQIQLAYRAEKPQKGRYREFWQCDIDTIGISSPLADAEIIALIYTLFKKLKFKKFVTKINSRQVLFSLMEKASLPEEKILTTLQSIDKLDKQGQEAVEQELERKGLKPETISQIFEELPKLKPNQELEEIFGYLKGYGIPQGFCQFEPTLVRGLDYYTGAIYETFVTKPKIGSLTGGGRWDNLIGQFTGKNIPATGTSIGLERIIEVIKELKLWPDLSPTPTRVLVTVFSSEYLKNSIEMVGRLREKEIPAELFLEPETRLDKQLKYADKKSIPYAVIIGPDEVKAKLVGLKNLKTGKQELLSPEKVIQKINPS